MKQRMRSVSVQACVRACVCAFFDIGQF